MSTARCESVVRASSTAGSFPEIVTACGKLGARVLPRIAAQVTKARDAGLRDTSACDELDRVAEVAERVTPGSRVAARGRCAEMDAAVTAGVARLAARNAAGDPSPTFPRVCGDATVALEKLGSPWAAVVKACCADLGVTMIEAARGACPPAIGEFRRVAARYRSPELVTALAKVPVSCSPK